MQTREGHECACASKCADASQQAEDDDISLVAWVDITSVLAPMSAVAFFA